MSKSPDLPTYSTGTPVVETEEVLSSRAGRVCKWVGRAALYLSVGLETLLVYSAVSTEPSGTSTDVMYGDIVTITEATTTSLGVGMVAGAAVYAAGVILDRRTRRQPEAG